MLSLTASLIYSDTAVIGDEREGNEFDVADSWLRWTIWDLGFRVPGGRTRGMNSKICRRMIFMIIVSQCEICLRVISMFIVS